MQVLAVAEADRPLQREDLLGEPAEDVERRVRLFRKTSRHIVGSEAAMRVKSRNPAAE